MLRIKNTRKIGNKSMSSFSLLCSLSRFLILISSCISQYSLQGVGALKFALCPKNVDNPFFDVARDGCFDRAESLSAAGSVQIECIYIGPPSTDLTSETQPGLIQEILSQVDGLSISIRNATAMQPVIEQALSMGLPVVTFDSDDSTSGRASYVGTDNYFFGERLAKLVNQLSPLGGTYGIVSDYAPNVVERERGLRANLDSRIWTEAPGSPTKTDGNRSVAVDQMRFLAETVPNLTAIIPVFGAPMFFPERWIPLRQEFRDIILVAGDDMSEQLESLARSKVDGLVGQRPYEMGVLSMDSLLALVNGKKLPAFQGTNLMEHVAVPLVLPELLVDENRLGALSILGFIMFGIISLTAICCIVWTYINHDVRVVKIAQPEFLYMIAIGSLVMGALLIPLSFDDSSDNYTDLQGSIRCMSLPWLAFLGFTITFSALYAKLWRVNRIFRASANFQRIEVSAFHVLVPFAILMTANIIVLLTWTLVDPVQYLRVDKPGLDPWNRVLSTYGTCVSDNSTPYVSVLALLNIGLLVIANYQAYEARGMESEFAESRYIAMAVMSMLQATVIGAPLLNLVREQPKVWYLTLCFMIFIIVMVILLLIFVPKILYARTFMSRSDASQRNLIRQTLGRTQAATARQYAATCRTRGDSSAFPADSTADPADDFGGSRHTDRSSHRRSALDKAIENLDKEAGDCDNPRVGNQDEETKITWAMDQSDEHKSEEQKPDEQKPGDQKADEQNPDEENPEKQRP